MFRKPVEDDDVDARFAAVLAEHGSTVCYSCGRAIDRGDVAWNNASTEAGTGYCTVEIICQGCEASIAHVTSWYLGIDDFGDVVFVLEDDWA